MTTKATVGLRTSFKVVKSLESVYSGGPVAMSKRGDFIAATREQDIVLYSIAQQRIAYVLTVGEEDDSDITSLCIRDDGSLLISAHASHQIREWDLSAFTFAQNNDNNSSNSNSNSKAATNEEKEEEEEEETKQVITQPSKAWKLSEAYVASMAFDKTGRLLAMGCTDARIRVRDVVQGYYTHGFRTPGGGVISTVAFCPFVSAGRPVLVSAGDDYAVRVWDLASKAGSELRGHLSAVQAVAFANNKLVLTAGRDNVVNVWDIYSHKNVATIPVFEGLTGIAVVDNGRLLYGAGEKGQIKVWSLPAAISGSSAATPLWTQPLKCAVNDDEDMKDDDNDDGDDDDDDRTSYLGLQYSEAADTLLTITSEQNLYLYKGVKSIAKSGDIYLQDKPSAVVGNRDQVADLQYVSPTRVVIVDNSERPQLIDTQTGAASVLEGHTDLVLCAAVLIIPPQPSEGSESSGDPLIATGSKDRLIRLWNGRTGKCLGVFEGHTGSVSAVALFGNKSGTTRLLSASNDTTMKLWDLLSNSDGRTWKQSKSRSGVRAHDKDVNSIAVAPNDKIVATGSQDRLVKLWDAETLSPITTLSGHRRGVWCVTFSNIDQVLASASADGTVRLWSLASYQCLKTFEGHSGPVLRCAFITRGMQLLSAGADALVKAWTIKTGECAGTFDSQHSDKIWALAVRPGSDGAAFATAGADSVVNFWRDCTEEVLEAQRAEHDRKILRKHELDAHIRNGEYRKALDAAFALGHPRQVLQILDALRENKSGGEGFTEDPLVEVVASLSEDNLRTLFTYVVDWNTSVKHAATAQAVLNAVFHTYSFARLKEVLRPAALKQALEALIPYTQRHMAHCDTLLQRSRIIDYTYATFSSLDTMVVEDNEVNVEVEDGEDEN